MAYKRYVHKKGKRHGPYYYKNVRDESGRVRSIYLGKVTSRGKRSLEVAIVFLTVLLIIISALFFIQNRNLVLSKIAAEEAKVPFEVDQILIKVLVKEKEFIEKELRVMNVHEEEQTIRIEAKEISHLVDVLDKEFIIKPGQTKIVRLNFSSSDSKNKIEQAPGVYIGKVIAKSDSYEKEVPVVVEIESKNVLFDMNLNPVARDRTVTQGSSTTFEIRVFNLQSIESFNIDMDFFVKDINGNTIISERESVVVQTQASFFKTLKIPEKLKTGNYVFVAQASLGNSVGTASYLFEVEEIAEEKQFSRFLAFCRNDPLCWALSVIVMLLLFAIGAYSYFFIGAFIYKKLFGISVPKRVEFAEKTLVREKKGIPVINSILNSFRNVAKRMQRAKEERAKRKLELEKQRLMLKEEKEKAKLELQERKAKLREGKLGEKERELELNKRIREERKKGRKETVFDFFHGLGFVKTEEEKRDIEKKKQEERERKLGEKERELEIEKKLKEKKLQEKEARKGDVGKCKRLVDKGYRALDRNNVGKADKIYIKIMDYYIKLPSERKIEVFKDINSFYKSLLIKKQQLKQKGAAEDARKKKFMEEEERAKVREQEKKIIEKEKKGNLAEEKRKEAKKKVFSFLHNLGLIKTEKEKQEIAKKKEAEIKQRELEKRKQQEEREKQKALEEERKEEEQRKREEEQRRKEEEQRKKNEERKQKELERKRQEEERRKQELEEQKKKELERKKEEEEKRKQEELKRKELERKKSEEEKIRQQGLEKKKQEEENRKREEQRRKEEEQRKKDEERKQKELERKRQEEERIRKQKEKEQKSKRVEGLKDLIEEKNSDINQLRGKIAEAYSGNKAMAKEILDIEKDINGLNNEKKILYGMYNESVAGRKELAKEHESKIAEWKEIHEAKLKEKNSIKNEIKQEYENELKELENELSKLSEKERKEEEKWKKLELKAKYKLEEHEREKSVNEEIKSQLEEKKELEHEYNKKKQSPGKGIAGREILQKQKELNEHIREHEIGIEKLKEKIENNEKNLASYGNDIEKLAKEKEKAEEKLWEARKEAGGLGYIASIFMPKGKKEAEKPVKQIVTREKVLQKKAVEVKAKMADFSEEITKEDVEKEEAKDEEEKKELQSTLRNLQRTAKQIEHKENIIEKLAREKEEKGKKEIRAEKKPGIFDKLIKGIESKVKAREQTEKEKEHTEIKRKFANKSRLFRKCHGMMVNAKEMLQRNDIGNAKRLYLKTRELYIRLEYHEKKEIYDELTDLYNKLKK